MVVGCLAMGAGVGAGDTVFRADADGGFRFDTGELRGRLRLGGKSMGLQEVVHGPTGRRLDRSNGLLSHYRVFTQGKRYGGGAWDWPGRAVLGADGAVTVTWPAEAGRPFELRAMYRWVDPAVVEVVTEVRAEAALPGFEVFLASYFDSAFDRARVALGAVDGKAAQWVPATRERGEWQMVPRERGVVRLIEDGRWRLEPNPVTWVVGDPFGSLAWAVREAGSGPEGLRAGLMAPGTDCFAVAMPHQAEAHYSVYLSLFGREVRAGEVAQARARLVVAVGDARVEEVAKGW